MSWWRSVGVLVALAALLGACTDPAQDRPADAPTATTTASPSPSHPLEPSGPPTASPRPDATADLGSLRLTLEEVASGLESPLQVAAAPSDTRTFVLEQPGRVRALSPGEPETVLDITDRVVGGGEQGLLGIAFHPDFADNGRVFLHYSGAPNGRTVLAEYAGEPGGSIDAGSERVLLEIQQPASNHNGGTVTFDPEGFLVLALGDGGAAGDRFDNAQDTSSLLGALLRLDVDSDQQPYGIPPDNPFVDGGGAPEVWHYGLRNPYRISFFEGQLYIADVGQDAVEEINVVAADASGLNFGWPILEGTRCFREADCDPSGTVLPVTEYTHEETGGCSVIAGEVASGADAPALRGQLFYTDLCAGFLRSIRVVDGAVVGEHDWTQQVGRTERILSFGRGADGALYAAVQAGRILRITAR